ncbi:MAG TPA: EamA family transporter [Candidatus Sulfotelmatobacter sp.]|nr:EamA family transporter [Candidatus Sulfotelmatobacter sp.]
MFLEQPAHILATIRESMNSNSKMVNIGGRPVIVPKPQTKSDGSHHRAENIKLALAFAAIYIVWGSTYLAIRYAIETIPPLVAVSIRHSVAGGVLLAWAWARGFRPRREHWVSGFIIGALFFLIGHGTLHWAEQYVGSGLAALLIATEPMFILVLAWMLGQRRIGVISAAGLILGVAGVAFLTGPELTGKGSTVAGVIAVLVGSLSWAAGVVISPKVKLPSEAIARTAVPLVCGAVLLLIASFVTGEFQHTNWSGISLRSVGGLAYLIVMGSIVAFSAYTWLLQRCSPTLVATHTYANPVVALLIGWLLAGEPLNLRIVFASLAILGAIVLIRRGEQEGAPAKQASTRTQEPLTRAAVERAS